MKITAATLLSVVCLLCVARRLQCARILAVIPTPSYSHQVPYRPLWLKLVDRGHEVVLITANPIPNVNRTNLTQIDVGASYSTLRAIDFIGLRFEGESWLTFVGREMLPLSMVFSENVLNNTAVKKIIAPESTATFDLVIAEMLFQPAIYAFAHRFNAPMIGVSSLGILALNEHALGGIPMASHEYTWEMEANTGSNLPFWKRLKNFVAMWHFIWDTYSSLFPPHQKLAEKYFGKGLPPMLDILKNTSAVFIEQSDAITPARHKLANMITFVSSHVKQNSPPLSKDLQRFADDAPEGFIYFSLGSNAMSSDLPNETLQIFLDVFAKLPYRVLWKWEKDDLPGKPDNVFTAKWFPQHSVLAHPNIKLFIYQGGLQSSEEAVHFRVPLLGFPILADQDYQVGRMEALEVGKRMEITTVARDELESAIREIITDKKYKENMIELNNVVNDNPYDFMDNLVWWTEYIIRHKGAPHLRSNLARQPWYQRCDMDIVVFLTIVAFIVVSNVLSLSAKIIVRVYKRHDTHSASQKQKLS